jgi:hypothetical protein
MARIIRIIESNGADNIPASDMVNIDLETKEGWRLLKKVFMAES